MHSLCGGGWSWWAPLFDGFYGSEHSFLLLDFARSCGSCGRAVLRWLLWEPPYDGFCARVQRERDLFLGWSVHSVVLRVQLGEGCVRGLLESKRRVGRMQRGRWVVRGFEWEGIGRHQMEDHGWAWLDR